MGCGTSCWPAGTAIGASAASELGLSPLYDRFLRHVPPGSCLLDAGCGAGRDSLASVERGYNVIVVAIARETAAFVWAIARMGQPAFTLACSPRADSAAPTRDIETEEGLRRTPVLR